MTLLAQSTIFTLNNLNLHEDGLQFLLDSCAEDTSLFVQLCGNCPNLLSEASLAVVDYFSEVHENVPAGIDLNLLCFVVL